MTKFRSRVADAVGTTPLKTRVAVFTGQFYSAEREGDDLVVYATGTDEFGGVRMGDADGTAVSATELARRAGR